MAKRSSTLENSVHPPPPLCATARLAEAEGEGGWANEVPDIVNTRADDISTRRMMISSVVTGFSS
jgi:hypothetical protein